MLKRLFDIFFSFIGLILLFPFFIIIGIAIILDSKGGVFFLQKRVGLNGKDFVLFKFRTMNTGADSKGLLTIGAKDNRVTRFGYFLRKYKIDELPQLMNVLIGDMSLVGPRPEVRKYVDLYSAEQLKVVSVRPGITDYASIIYINESELLLKAEDPEECYVKEIMPAKLKLNLQYIQERGFLIDLKIIGKTVLKIIS
jgi:lipopolysaccharide/colanic/teichoic acid biosynthesis glycosyltransferase